MVISHPKKDVRAVKSQLGFLKNKVKKFFAANVIRCQGINALFARK